MKSLDEIMLSYRTDKASLYHNYTPVYESYFEPFRQDHFTFLELGLGDKNSLNREGEDLFGWAEYFPNAQIIGIDNDPTKLYQGDRVKTFVADQTNGEFIMKELGFGIPFIIIDDASHIQSNTIKSFEILFPHLSKGGLYCIEDCVTAFWPSWEGNDVISYDNESIFINMAYETIFTYMFQLVYYVNLKRQETFNPPQSINIPDWIKEIDSIHFHHSQIIIKKK
jgi:hypothetical protein